MVVWCSRDMSFLIGRPVVSQPSTIGEYLRGAERAYLNCPLEEPDLLLTALNSMDSLPRNRLGFPISPPLSVQGKDRFANSRKSCIDAERRGIPFSAAVWAELRVRQMKPPRFLDRISRSLNALT